MQQQHIDSIASKLHGGNITYAIHPNEFEQRTLADAEHAKNKITAKEELAHVFDKLIDFDGDPPEGNSSRQQQQQRRDRPSPVAARKPQHMDPPVTVGSNTLLYWIMMHCRPDKMLLTDDEDDLVAAVREFRQEFSDALSSDAEFTREYTFPDDLQRSSDKKTCSEALLRCLHHPDWDLLLHDAIPSYAAKLYSINIIISDMNGVRHTYYGNKNSNDFFVLVQNRNGRFLLSCPET